MESKNSKKLKRWYFPDVIFFIDTNIVKSWRKLNSEILSSCETRLECDNTNPNVFTLVSLFLLLRWVIIFVSQFMTS